jgi:hypothetical protein
VRSQLAIEVEGESLVRTGAELAVAGCFRDQRPLRGGAGVADWRLCGFLSSLVAASRVRGEWGDAALVLTHGRLGAPRLLVIGLGSRGRYGSEAHRAAVRAAVDRALDLGAGTVSFDLPAPTHDDSPEMLARGLVEGACASLDARPARLLLRVVAPPGLTARLRAALEQAITVFPRGATSIRMLKTPVPPAGGGGGRNRSGRVDAQPRA